MHEEVLNGFLQDIRAIARLSRHEERELSQKIIDCACYNTTKLEEKCPACTESIGIFVTHNLLLAIKVSSGYLRDNVIPLPDLVGYGIMGLFKAAAKYDHRKNVRFASYAAFWIKDAVLRAFRTCANTPSIPTYLMARLWKVAKIIKQLETEEDALNIHNIPTEALIGHTGLSEKDVEILRSVLGAPIFLEDISEQSQETSIVAPVPTPEDLYTYKERRRLILELIQDRLTPLQLEIIIGFFGLGGEPVETVQLLAIKSGLTVAQIKVVKDDALELLENSDVLELLYKES